MKRGGFLAAIGSVGAALASGFTAVAAPIAAESTEGINNTIIVTSAAPEVAIVDIADEAWRKMLERDVGRDYFAFGSGRTAFRSPFT